MVRIIVGLRQLLFWGRQLPKIQSNLAFPSTFFKNYRYIEITINYVDYEPAA